MLTQTTTNNNNNQPPLMLTAEVKNLVRAEVELCLYQCVHCVSTETAAKLLSVEPGTVRTYIKNGKLAASKIGKDYSIRMSAIQQLLQRTAVPVVVRMDKRFKKQAV